MAFKGLGESPTFLSGFPPVTGLAELGSAARRTTVTLLCLEQSSELSMDTLLCLEQSSELSVDRVWCDTLLTFSLSQQNNLSESQSCCV